MEEKLIKCHVCQKEIAETANKCPHCGATTERAKKLTKGIIVALVVIAVIWIINLILQYIIAGQQNQLDYIRSFQRR